MLLKKPSILLSSYSHLSIFAPTSPHITTSSCLQLRRSEYTRPYAMVSDGHSAHRHDITWPEISKHKGIPTPYQIFNQKKGSPYSKRRFYELVKLYHPDMHGQSDSSLPYEVKVERYRLVVAANDILSDPVKRGAYDLYGAGWNGHPGVSRDPSNGPAGTWGSSAHRGGWGGDPNGPSQNATWEDWERWYQRDSKGPQEPLFFSNTTFVSLLVMFAVLGWIGQATRVGNYSVSLLEQRDVLHDEMSKELRRRRKETEMFGTREEKIQMFLKQRDPMWGLENRPLLPAPSDSSESHGRS